MYNTEGCITLWALCIQLYNEMFSSLYGTHSSEGKGDRGKKTSDRARTRDLRSIAEFQPREPWRPVEILRPPSLLCTGHRQLLSSDTSDLRLEAGTVCGVMVAATPPFLPNKLYKSYIHDQRSMCTYNKPSALYNMQLLVAS